MVDSTLMRGPHASIPAARESVIQAQVGVTPANQYHEPWAGPGSELPQMPPWRRGANAKGKYHCAMGKLGGLVLAVGLVLVGARFKSKLDLTSRVAAYQ